MEQVQYVNESFVGTVNCNGEVEVDSGQVATESLVFMFNTINSNWKIPLGYFLITVNKLK